MTAVPLFALHIVIDQVPLTNFILAIAALITALSGLVAAFRAVNKSNAANATANATAESVNGDIPHLKERVGANSALIPILNARIESLETAFHALLMLTQAAGITTEEGTTGPTGPSSGRESAPH